MYPKLRENVWHVHPSHNTAALITSRATYQVPAVAALHFLKMRSYFTGHHSLEAIAEKSGLSMEDMTALLQSLEPADIVYEASTSDKPVPVEHVRETFTQACRIWSQELALGYIGNEFARGELPKTVLIGWLLEMYHYIRDFPHAIEHGARCATGELQDILHRYAEEEKGHEEFVLRTLMNLGMSKAEVQTSIPLLSTRMIAFQMRELFEVEPSSALMVAAVLEAQEFNDAQIGAFKEHLRSHYGIQIDAMDPYFEHQRIDVGLGHAELLATHLDLIHVIDLQTLDQIVNKIHDLKHAFDLQSVEIKHYFTALNGKYVPRQPVDFASI